MNEYMAFTDTALHLVNDEIEEFPNIRTARYRIRVWRAKGQWPIILVSPAEGNMTPPHRLSSRVANYVLQAICGFPGGSFHYFESGNGDPKCEVSEVFFEVFGYPRRLCVFKPISKPASWEFIEAIVGQPVER